MNSESERLKCIVSEILDERNAASSLREEIIQLKVLLNACSGHHFDSSDDIAAGETRGANGLAISPRMASMCVDDFVRTIIFIRGLNHAVRDRLKTDTKRPVRVLYAGCGPYAVLAVPLMSLYGADEVQFLILDIHQQSIDSARSLVSALGFSDHVQDSLVTDALAYEINAEERPDIILMELMNACLEKEPQVAVAMHLMEQVPGAVLLPESVIIDARLVDIAREFEFGEDSASLPVRRDRRMLGKIFELSKETIQSWSELRTARLPAGSIRLPDPLDRRYTPMLFTAIRVYGEQQLGDYASGLTTPRALSCAGKIRAGTTLGFHYRLGGAPSLVCEVEDDDSTR